VKDLTTGKQGHYWQEKEYMAEEPCEDQDTEFMHCSKADTLNRESEV
jgi:hypothetical protein